MNPDQEKREAARIGFVGIALKHIMANSRLPIMDHEVVRAIEIADLLLNRMWPTRANNTYDVPAPRAPIRADDIPY